MDLEHKLDPDLASTPKLPSFGDNLRMIWGLRAHFGVYLLPAFGILLLALVQADLALTATTAGQRVIDGLAAKASGAPAPPAPSSGANTVSEQILTLLTGNAGPAELAMWMTLFLVLASAMWIGVEQARTLVHEHFRHRLQSKLLASFASELAGTRAKRATGSSSQIFNDDSSALSGLLIFQTVATAENVVRLGVYAFGLARVYGWRIVLLIVPVIILFQISVTAFFGKREMRAIERSARLGGKARSTASDFFDVLPRLVFFRGESAHARRLLDLSRESANANRAFQRVSSIKQAVEGIVTTLSLPLVIALLSLPAVIALADSGVSPGTIVQAQMLLMLLTVSTSALIGVPSNLAEASPSVRRVDTVLRIPLPGTEPTELRAVRARETPPSLKVSELCFQYPGTKRPILRAISFEVPSGATVGVIGGNGSGKSTLATLLVGDLCPTGGRILYDDVDVTPWHLWWRRELVGFLPEEPGFIRGTTLEENVMFGRSREDVRDYDRALEASGVAAIAKSKAEEGGMQMEIDTSVKDFLSTGERRRVGIARLLLGDQRLWIFDEPGSGLAPSTMGGIAAALAPGSPVMSGKTSLIITHDPDVFRTDFNLFLQDGVIAAWGPHEELRRTSPEYAALVDRNTRERLERSKAASA